MQNDSGALHEVEPRADVEPGNVVIVGVTTTDKTEAQEGLFGRVFGEIFGTPEQNVSDETLNKPTQEY